MKLSLPILFYVRIVSPIFGCLAYNTLAFTPISFPFKLRGVPVSHLRTG